MPASMTKIGAQKWVIQRVMNSAGSATSRGLIALAPKKSRAWSSAITISTRPRSRSMESRRGRTPPATVGSIKPALPAAGGDSRA
jgi:hypothetical protein